MYQNTSMMAYVEVKQDLGERQRQVLQALGADSLTNTELSRRMAIPINCVTPRIFELRGKGIIVEDKKRVCCITGRIAIAWKVKPTVNFDNSGQGVLF